MLNSQDFNYLDVFSDRCNKMYKATSSKANIYRAISILSSILILILSGGTVIISRFTSTPSVDNAITVLAALIGIIQTFLSVYTPEKKASLVKKISQTLNKVVMEVRKLRQQYIAGKLSESELNTKLESLSDEVDKLDLTVFDLALNRAPQITLPEITIV